MKIYRQVFRWAAHWAARSVWLPLAGKAAAGVLAVATLAHVGSGAAARVNELPVAPVAVSVAPPPKAKARARPSAAPSASCKKAEVKKTEAWTEDGKLILNRAAAADLRKLPRIGKKRAEAIVRLRGKLGRFKRVRDLLRIRGIGYRMLQALKPLVVVDAPPAKKK